MRLQAVFAVDADSPSISALRPMPLARARAPNPTVGLPRGHKAASGHHLDAWTSMSGFRP
jgi:hypothetical protein